MRHGLDDMTYQTLQVAKWYGVSPIEIGNLTNLEFYDWYEFMLVQNEIDKRHMERASRGHGH